MRKTQCRADRDMTVSSSLPRAAAPGRKMVIGCWYYAAGCWTTFAQCHLVVFYFAGAILCISGQVQTLLNTLYKKDAWQDYYTANVVRSQGSVEAWAFQHSSPMTTDHTVGWRISHTTQFGPSQTQTVPDKLRELLRLFSRRMEWLDCKELLCQGCLEGKLPPASIWWQKVVFLAATFCKLKIDELLPRKPNSKKLRHERRVKRKKFVGFRSW